MSAGRDGALGKLRGGARGGRREEGGTAVAYRAESKGSADAMAEVVHGLLKLNGRSRCSDEVGLGWKGDCDGQTNGKGEAVSGAMHS